jgi:hypothetical protein
MQYRGHTGVVYAVAFAPNGRTFASGSRDSTILIWDATALAEARAGRATADELNQSWIELGGPALTARKALWHLVAREAESVPLLQARLKPAEAVGQTRIERLIQELDDDRFEVREKAARELDAIDLAAIPRLRRALERPVSAEVRRRVTHLLENLERDGGGSEHLRRLRGVRVLEFIGSVEARRLLESLAAADPDGSVGHDARGAIQRLLRRHD